jgi:hypothetical protein
MTASIESKADLRTAQRELRECADALTSAANLAGNACEVSGTKKDYSVVEQHMRLAVTRADVVLHELQSWMERCKKVPRWSE